MSLSPSLRVYLVHCLWSRVGVGLWVKLNNGEEEEEEEARHTLRVEAGTSFSLSLSRPMKVSKLQHHHHSKCFDSFPPFQTELISIYSHSKTISSMGLLSDDHHPSFIILAQRKGYLFERTKTAVRRAIKNLYNLKRVEIGERPAAAEAKALIQQRQQQHFIEAIHSFAPPFNSIVCLLRFLSLISICEAILSFSLPHFERAILHYLMPDSLSSSIV